MSRKVNIITISCRSIGINYATPEENLDKTGDILDSFSNLKPDLICLPEAFLEFGAQAHPASIHMTEPLLDMLGNKAKKLNSYIIAGGYEHIGNNLFNAAWIINRSGSIAGTYRKCYPTVGEMGKYGIIPGDEIPVFKTEFGTIGVLICFDIDWPHIWHELGSKGAEMVVWIAAYEGGFPLQAYACSNFYYVVSSVRTDISKIIDKTGRIVSSTTKWTGWTYYTLDMDKCIFHIDNQYNKLLNIQKQLGLAVRIESFHEENRFTIESQDPKWPVSRIIREFGLETFEQYHRRTESLREKILQLK